MAVICDNNEWSEGLLTDDERAKKQNESPDGSGSTVATGRVEGTTPRRGTVSASTNTTQMIGIGPITTTVQTDKRERLIWKFDVDLGVRSSDESVKALHEEHFSAFYVMLSQPLA